ncbi:hypothetical protein DIPPA_00787 [Diplonema papillatum]|nr:hypothetical protein DIPPA_00787 [Diplonema papillatum]
MIKDSVEGLLEGNESNGFQVLYKFLIFTVTALGLVGAILPLFAGGNGFPILLAVSNVGFLSVMFTLIRWHRVKGEDAGFKKIVYALMFLILVNSVFGLTLFSMPVECDECPMCICTPVPDYPTPAPTPPPTPVPTALSGFF